MKPLRLYEIAGVPVGVSICEDAWRPGGPILDAGHGGAQLIVNINGSPYHAGKIEAREAILEARADEASCTILYINLVGGQDELVFDGASLVISPDGEVITRASQYAEDLFVTDVELAESARRERSLPVIPVSSESTATDRSGVALTRRSASGPRPRCTAPSCSARATTCARTASPMWSSGFRAASTRRWSRPSRSTPSVPSTCMACSCRRAYSSDHSITDAEALAQNLGIEHRTVVIEPAFTAMLDMLAPSFGELPPDITEENLQPRVRGMVLMALSNKFGWLVLTTGNKSEMAVGYTTLYGDMAGGFSVIKDVWKTMVYDVCEYRNAAAGRELIPTTVLTKPPSAELRPDQVDTDSLPPYVVLDRILDAYIEDDKTAGDLIEIGRGSRLGSAHRPTRRPVGVQAPPGASGCTGDDEGVR